MSLDGKLPIDRPPGPQPKISPIGEFVLVFGPAATAYGLLLPRLGDDLLTRHGVLFCINLLMLCSVWIGLRLRGQSCARYRPAISTSLGAKGDPGVFFQSIAVLLASLVAVVAAAVAMAILFGRPEGADMQGFAFLHGNLPMLLIVLPAVYLNASFGEEVIYRGFLITRIAELGSDSKFARWLGLLISSVLFGLVHSDWALVGIVQMACMGFTLGTSYLLVNRNLWVTILAHGYLDTILIVQMYLAID